MHDRRRAGLGHVLAEPARRPLDGRDLARLVDLPEAEEAPQLALEVAGRLAEALQPGRLPVDGVDLDERVDELVGRSAARSSALSSSAGISVVITWPSTRSIR